MIFRRPLAQCPPGQGARPFYDLISNIAAEEFGHIELVAVAINTMLTGATPVENGKLPKNPFGDLKDQAINPHHFIAGGQGALCQDSRGNPWTGDNVFSSGDLIEDLTHNFFLATRPRRSARSPTSCASRPACPTSRSARSPTRATGRAPSRRRRRKAKSKA